MVTYCYETSKLISSTLKIVSLCMQNYLRDINYAHKSITILHFVYKVKAIRYAMSSWKKYCVISHKLTGHSA